LVSASITGNEKHQYWSKKTLLVELLTLTLWYESGDPYINRKNISAIA